MSARPGLQQFIYGVSPSDPSSIAGAALVLVVVSVAACAVPARRALRIQPTEAMRES
ncbi:MAG TPA: hypothetical protein VFK20_03190 [Vicinamibacterales bacterium]|nr:hypothetical protein [Vicinamibacterales bacterium]